MLHDLWAWHPPVGVYIGILGFLAVLVALIRDPTTIGRREKAAWVFVMFALLLLEIKSVYQDRNEHDREQAEARQRETESFKAIAKGIDDTINLSQSQFHTTVAQQSAQFAATMKKTQVNINEITGDDSYAIVYPDFTPTGKDVFPLLIRLCDKCSEYSIPNAHVNIENDAGVMGNAYTGNVDPGIAEPLTTSITPSRTEERTYRIMVLARNKPTKEILKVRFNSESEQWECSVHVVRQVKLPHFNPKTKMAEGEVMKVLEDSGWSSNSLTPLNPAKTTIIH